MMSYIEKMKLFPNFVRCNVISCGPLAAGGTGPDDRAEHTNPRRRRPLAARDKKGFTARDSSNNDCKMEADPLFDAVGGLSYAGIFLLLVGVNASPVLMPPSWVILASFHLLDPTLDVILLAAVGATGATAGRFLLKRVSIRFRRFVGPEQRENLDTVGRYLNGKRYGYVLASFLFGATPLPSNMLFIAYGLMHAKSAGIYAGFWAGRMISYVIMIHLGDIVLRPFVGIFEDRLVGILVVDGIGLCVVAVFAFIDWTLLITKKRLRFTRPRIWRI